MTVSLDEDTAQLVERVLRANTQAVDKRSGIYWPEGQASEMEEAREQIAAQLDQ
jgi:hypothetical protein